MIADFGEKDNKFYDDFIIYNNRSKKLIPQDMREKLEKENDEFLRSRLLICDIREQCFLENYFLYGYTKRLSQDEFICRFNKGLYEYVNNKIQLVKTQGRSVKSSKWQGVLDEILDWFVEKNINYKEVRPLLEIENPKKLVDTNDALWAIADDMRARKEDGEFETYMDAYRWAEKNKSKRGINITAKKLERAYHKAKSEGKIE